MPHETALIATMSVALALAFVGGFLATRLGLPAIVGYLLAGVVVGPFTPGFVADAGLAPQLAEIGVILLMFGVGIHFSMRDLLDVRSVAVPGAVGQIVAITAPAVGLTIWWAWGIQAGIVLGLAVSVASTVVLLRALTENDLLETTHGKIAIGWLIVEDLLTVLALVLLPTMAGGGDGHGGAATTAAAAPDRMERHPGDGGADPGEGRRPGGSDAVRRGAFRTVALDPGLADRLARAVHPGGAGGRVRGRVRLVGPVRCLTGAGRVPGRTGRRRVRPEPPGGRGRASAPRRLRGAVLRLGRNAVRPVDPGDQSRVGSWQSSRLSSWPSRWWRCCW